MPSVSFNRLLQSWDCVAKICPDGQSRLVEHSLTEITSAVRSQSQVDRRHIPKSRKE